MGVPGAALLGMMRHLNGWADWRRRVNLAAPAMAPRSVGFPQSGVDPGDPYPVGYLLFDTCRAGVAAP